MHLAVSFALAELISRKLMINLCWRWKKRAEGFARKASGLKAVVSLPPRVDASPKPGPLRKSRSPVYVEKKSITMWIARGKAW